MSPVPGEISSCTYEISVKEMLLEEGDNPTNECILSLSWVFTHCPHSEGVTLPASRKKHYIDGERSSYSGFVTLPRRLRNLEKPVQSIL